MSGVRQRGVTLVELVIAIVVISVSITAVMGLLGSISISSAAPMLRTQSTSIAAAYLDEVLAKPFQDPDGIDNEVTRTTFDDVDDYNTYTDVGVRNQTDTAVAGLNQYTARVDVFAIALGAGANNIPALRVQVTVTDPSGARTVISGYRTNYAGQVLY